MRKHKILAWVLAVVMLFSVLGVFPMTVSAAGTEYADDATAVAAGYYFRTGAAGTATYYNHLVTACNEVADGGTVYVLANYTQSTGTDIIGLNGNNRLWDSKTITIDGGGHTATLSGNRPYNVANSNVTFRNWTLTSSTTIGQVRPGSTLTLDNVTVNSTSNAWGSFAVYGTLILQNGSTITASGSGAPNPGSNASNTGVFLQKQVQTGDILTSSDSIVPTLILQDTAQVKSNAQNALWFGSIPNGAAVQVQAGTVLLSGSIYGLSASVTLTFGGKAFGNMTDDEKITYKKPLVFFGLIPNTYINDTEAVSDGQYFRIGAEGSGDYYAGLVAAATAVANNGTIEMLANWTTNATNTINPAAAKTFTLNGNGHTMTGTAVQYNLDLYNCTMIIQDLTFADSNSVAQMPFRIQPTADLTMKNCTYSVSNASWGGIGVMGTLTLDNTTVTTTSGTQTAGAIRMQNQNVGNTPTLTLKNGATVTGSGTYTGIFLVNDSRAYEINVETSDVSVSGVANIGANVTVNLGTPTNETKAAWKTIYDTFGVQWSYDSVARVGATDYNTVAEAIAAVAEGGTVTLTADLVSAIVANNNKSFTIDGDGHSVTLSGSTAFTVNAGTTVTLLDITIQSSNVRNAVDLAGGALILGNGATVRNIYANANGNSAGNGVRATATGASLTVLNGAAIQSGGGAIVFDGFGSGTGTVTISGGTITSDYYLMIFAACIMDVTISGGTLTCTAATSANNAGAFRYYSGTHSLVITGGTINFANNTNLFSNASTLTGIATPAWVRILGGVINKTTSGSEASLNVDAVKTAIAGLSLASGAAQLRIPVQASYGNSGIAFASTVDKATYDALVSTYGAGAVKTGTLILPTTTAPGSITYDNIIALGSGKYLDVVNSGFYNAETAETDGNYLWYGSIVNLKAKNTNRDFTGVGYIGVQISAAGIGSATVAVCGASPVVANARALATAAEPGNDAQNAILTYFTTGEMV